MAALREFHPDVALPDIAMPACAASTWRANCARSPGPRELLVAATGWGSEAHRQRSLDAGFDDHLIKPLNLEDLSRRLAQRAPSDEARRG